MFPIAMNNKTISTRETLAIVVYNIEKEHGRNTTKSKEEIRNTFDRYRGNTIVQSVMDGNTTFTQEYSRYRQVKWLPHEQRYVYSVEECMGEDILPKTTLANSWDGPALMGGGAFVYILAMQKNVKMNRRKFLALLTGSTLGGAAVGLGTIVTIREGSRVVISLSQKDMATYLDKAYQHITS